MNLIAYYLPQFHRVKENDEWWGEGFTEWNNVKKSISLYNGHNQPRIPLNNNYYDLEDINTIKWQAELSKEYGISFCVYHYWFNGKLLLEKPMENLLKNKDIYFPFCFSWANENWTNAWEGRDSKILLSNDFDDENDWVNHFNYLLPFFLDKRYLKESNNPIFVIYRPQMFKKLDKFIFLWNKLAKKNGFEKIVFIFQSISFIKENPENINIFDYGLEFQPGYNELINSKSRHFIDMKREKVSKFIQDKFNFYLSLNNIMNNISLKKVKSKYSYDFMIESILKNEPLNSKMIPGAMKDWDNTPRYGKKGKVYHGSTPEKFALFMEKQIYRAKNIYKKNAIFIFAWNEWGEGGYLEPDEEYGFQYLNMLKKILEKNKEFEYPKVEESSNIKINLEV